MTPTPVLSDTCSSPLSQSGRAGNLGRREINVGLRQRESQNNTRRRVSLSSPHCQTDTKRREKKSGEKNIWTERIWKLKEAYPI